MIERLFPLNENHVDRTIRVLLGVGLITIVFVGPKTLWGLVGVVPLVTGLVGRCPLYRLMGVSTASTAA